MFSVFGDYQLFFDRKEAGRRLAQVLAGEQIDQPIVLAIPRGGVPIGYEIAQALSCPLSVIVSRKIGAPDNPELAIGALSENSALNISADYHVQSSAEYLQIEQIVAQEKRELQRRVALYRHGQALPELSDKTAIIVDDGLATGMTARAAILACEKLMPKKIIYASPVCASDSLAHLKNHIPTNVEIFCLFQPTDLRAISQYYRHFDQLTDESVLRLLNQN